MSVYFREIRGCTTKSTSRNITLETHHAIIIQKRNEPVQKRIHTIAVASVFRSLLAET